MDLIFNQPLVATVGAPIPAAQLLTRLQTLADELLAVDQDNVNLSLFQSVAQDLANKKLLKHNNAGVKVYTCCCIADILRIYAPDAPYLARELSAIFRAFFVQLRQLVNPENPYYLQQNHLLRRLAEVRSVILVTDLPDASALVTEMFTMFYEMAAKFPAKLEPLVADMLAEVLAECETVPPEVLRLIISRFGEESQLLASNSNITNPGLAYSLAICEANIHKMSRQVTQYFSELLSETSSEAQELQTLQKIHHISVRIWRSVPELLGSVTGLLDDELSTGEERVRLLATATVGEMVAAAPTSFAVVQRPTWVQWLKKTTDASPAVRARWVDTLPSILGRTNSADAAELRAGLTKCMLDTHDKVRFLATRALDRLEMPVFTRVVCTSTVLTTLFSLMREKHAEIRTRAVQLVASIYNHHATLSAKGEVLDYGNTPDDEVADLDTLIRDGIPNHVLALNYINDKDVTAQVDKVLFEKLVPFESDSATRVHRIAAFYRALDDKSRLSFLAICKRQQAHANALRQYVALAEIAQDKENTSSKGKLDKVVTWLAATLPVSINGRQCLERVVRLENGRLFNLIRFAVSPDSDYRTVRNSITEFLTIAGDIKNIRLKDKTHVTTADMVSTFKLVLYRSLTILFNRTNVGELLGYAKNPADDLHVAANALLEHIAAIVPDAFKLHVRSLSDTIVVERVDGYDPKANNLRTLYHIIKRFPDLYPEALLNTLVQIAVSGLPREVRYAVKLLGQSDRKEIFASEVAAQVLPPSSNSHMAAIAELHAVDSVVLDLASEEITAHLLTQLKTNLGQTPSDDTTWVDDATLEVDGRYSELYAKLLALRIVTNKLRYLDVGDSAMADAVAKPLKLLVLVLGQNESRTPKGYQYRLRLRAGECLLKLAKVRQLQPFFNHTVVNRMGRLLLDESEQVRELFARKLHQMLWNNELPEEFLHIGFVTGNEPNAQLRAQASRWIAACHKRAAVIKDIRFERVLTRLIHSIAHEENFGEDEATSATKQLTFYLKSIANGDNVSLLYYFASRVKQYHDATIDAKLYETGSEETTRLYRAAELAQFAIQTLAEVKHWTVSTWPGKIKLYSDLFAPMNDYTEAQRVASTQYVLDELRTVLVPELKRGFARRVEKLGKPAKTAKRAAPVLRPRKRHVDSDDEESDGSELEEVVSAPQRTRRSARAHKKVSYAEMVQDSE